MKSNTMSNRRRSMKIVRPNDKIKTSDGEKVEPKPVIPPRKPRPGNPIVVLAMSASIYTP